MLRSVRLNALTKMDIAISDQLGPIVTQHWRKLIVSGVVLYVTTKLIAYYARRRRTKQRIILHRDRIAKATNNLREDILELEQDKRILVTKKRQEILNYDLPSLLEKLKNGDLKPIEVLKAYQAKAIEVDEDTNCICEFIIEATEWAKALEEVPQSQRGPLYGLPISVKECFFVKGYYATGGMSMFIKEPVSEDSPFVSRLKALGAIPFCLTNVPQTMKTYDCSNPVYGPTGHPLDSSRSPGGSSGGETTLLARGGSILGIGTDVGGSLRIPSHFCGVVGLKPTTGRMYHLGRRTGSLGIAVGVQSNTGVLCRTVDGVTMLMQLLLKDPQIMTETDSTVVPLPWNERLFKPQRKLRIGWYDSIEDMFPITPACKRAVHTAVGWLQKAGHVVVPFTPPRLSRLERMYIGLVTADGGANTMPLLHGDFIDKSIELNMLMWNCPEFLRNNFIKHLIKLRSPYLGANADAPVTTTSELWLCMGEIAKIRVAVLKAWGELELDVVIAPGFPFQALRQSNPSRLSLAAPCTGAYNLVDFPVGSVPVIKSNEKDAEKLARDYPRGDALFDMVHKDQKDTLGFPAGVQVIGKPWQEEAVLHAMQEIEDLRKNNCPDFTKP